MKKIIERWDLISATDPLDFSGWVGHKSFIILAIRMASSIERF